MILYNLKSPYNFDKAENEANFDRWQLCHDGGSSQEGTSAELGDGESAGSDVWV